jgi:hypothetical protein
MARRSLMLAFLPLIAAVIPIQAQTSAKAQPIGTLANGVYHHDQTGIEFILPSDWVVVNQGSSSDGAQYVNVRDTVSNVVGLVWLKRRNIDPADIPAVLSKRLDSKVAQRNNFEGYKFRSDSVRQTTIGGRPALGAVADYVSAGQQMVEYITWIDGERSRVLFSARMPAAELPAFQSRFDAVIESVAVP